MAKDIEKINKIIDIIGNSEITELSLEEENLKVVIKKPKLVLNSIYSSELDIISNKENSEKITIEKTVELKSNTVGRFYFIDNDPKEKLIEGSLIKKGDIIGCIKAIGVKTDVKSEFTGQIKEILIKNGEVAEYGKVLMSLSE